MQIHELKPKNKAKAKKRVGRGGKKGTYSGAGGKGQKGRAGAKFKPLIRGWIKRYPKLKGYRFNIQSKCAIINLDVLEKKFNSGDTISPAILIEKRIIRKTKAPLVKILSRGEITKPLNIKDCKVSQKAKEKIEKVQGKII
ncbi:MAG TPA: 50S ribosomal protein L15 [Candidatus Pacearchaeota archaeon]|nr:50S ribosomal protein L15 [Candidatus Parcubacteria bacterium]HNP79661.1 50S ribosomal protein L15 [Candidatus Pacearchaeota archaeon]HOC53617.1 50S ribosomal protein L15 [Candidatus Pacearchaeota archaeon]HQM24677.1 50S ribosomal protein L15 [Candidatus Pacearchaeota archaeon]